MILSYMSAWLTVALACIALAALLQVLYRWLVHPLSSFPGPWTHAITDIPSAVKLSSGVQHCHYYDLHRKYGSVVRVAPNELLFTSAGAWEDIYGYRKGKVMEKSPIFIGVASPMNGYVGVGLAKGKEHTRQRKALAPALSKNALYGQEEIIQRHISALIEALQQNVAQGHSSNMSDYYSFITFDVIGDLSYGEPFGCLAQGSATEWAKSIINVTIFATYDQAIRRVAGVDTWFRTLLIKAFMPTEVAKWRVLHMQKSKEKTLQRLADTETTNKDVIHHLLRNEDSKKALSPTEIILNMVLFASAGSETTSITLTAWTYLVCTHKNVYDRLCQEIRSTFASRDEIKVGPVMKLPYLGATINEALRLFPAGAVAMQRVVPAGGAIIDGHHVPAGYTVSISPWVAGRSPSNFHDPDSFRPERWLQESAEFADDKLHASRPFGYGPKKCIGEDLSFLEMRLIGSHLLSTFDLELDMTGHRRKDNEAWCLSPKPESIKLYQVLLKPNLWVRLTARQNV